MLSERDKRTIRIAAVGVCIYLVGFYGLRGMGKLEESRREYQQLLLEARHLEVKLQRHENKLLRLEKLRAGMNLSSSTREKLVVQVSSAIQQAAQSGGVKLGPIREVAGSASAKQLAAMQLEAVGPVQNAMTLLHQLETLGYPLVVDSLQIDADTKQPGNVKMSLRVVVMDYKQWKTADERDA